MAREGPKRTPRVAVLITDARPNAVEFQGNSAVDDTRRAIVWLEGTWGPTMVVATEDSPVLPALVSGPLIEFDPERPVEGLARLLERCLHRR